MNESKIQLTERLRREGRWGEASKWKDERIKTLRAEGMKRNEASGQAWEELEQKYPPTATIEESMESPPADDPGDTTEEVASVPSGSCPFPASWGDIPDTAPFEVEVEWVHQNRVLVVEERPGGSHKLRWERARKPAPSYGAINLMEYAATNRKGFMDILQRVKPSAGEEDEENIKREKKSIAEIREIIGQFQEDADTKLLAGVPQGVQKRTRAVLDDWTRRFGLTLPDGAKAALEASMAGIVQGSMDAASKDEARAEKTAHMRKVIEDVSSGE